MKICGIEFKSSEATCVVIEKGGDGALFDNAISMRLAIDDDESSSDIKSFHAAFETFLRENTIEVVVIKKRAKKGRMAGGAVSFKLEALMQMNAVADVVLLSPQAIAAAHKKDPFEYPGNLKAYQQNAYMAAALYLRQQ